MILYQPEKYKVFVGNGKSGGFCTVWNDPEVIFNKSQVIKEKVALLGSLYSSYGANIIIRNLALNPHIRTLFIWGHGTLSNTQYGLTGKNAIKNIWEHKFNASDLEESLISRKEILSKITKEVKLIDISDLTLEKAEELVKKENQNSIPYMQPFEFPKEKEKQIDTFPSEMVGWLVRGKYILETWSRVVERIMRYGTVKGSQHGYKQKELIGMTWIINNEDPKKPNLSPAKNWPKELKNLTGVNIKSIKEYKNVFLSPELPKGISYTYGSRLIKYPDGTNQIEEILVKQLKESPNTRRAVATTLIPSIDKNNNQPPCITQIQCLQTNGKVHLLATARSQDIFKAGIPNAFGLRMLQQEIAKKTNFEVGCLQITSQSAHIYEQDWDHAQKLSECLYWKRAPNLVFDPQNQSDPRGNVLINVNKGKIITTLQAFGFQELIKLEAKTAKEIAAQIAQLELLSRSDHLLDIGMELQKAEIAIKKGIEYKQDRPLPL